MITPRQRALLRAGILILVLGVLLVIFPRAYAFVELAAREFRYFWWLILMVALALWFIWGLGRKPKP